MEFDLYFDESGDFRSSCQNWLIGGYLRPRQRGADAQAVQWWTNVREELESVCAGLLRNGYKLSHCSQNSFPAKRTIQPKVLKSLTENIQAVGGFPVIFFHRATDNPRDVYEQTPDREYLIVLARGYVALERQLRAKYPNEEHMFIYLHLSRREQYREMPFFALGTHDDDVREQSKRILQICAEGFAGSEDLVKSLESLELLSSATPPCLNEYGHEIHNPLYSAKFNIHNVICDYICNSYYYLRSGRRQDPSLCIAYKAALENAIVIDVTEVSNAPERAPAPRETPASITQEASKSVPEKTPEPGTQEAFERAARVFTDEKERKRFNRSDSAARRNAIHQLCNEIKPRVERQIELSTLNETIDELLAQADKIEYESSRAELKTNLLLFKVGILNHWGKLAEIEELSPHFLGNVNAMTDSSGADRHALIAMFVNRQIVIHTDLFDLDAADRCFQKLEEYWSSELKRSKNLLEGVGANLEEVVCPEYGKAIGSILQTTRQRLRQSKEEETFSLYQKARDRASMARLHLNTDQDLSRLMQTMADLESEAKFHEEAFWNLLEVARLESGAEWNQKYEKIMSDASIAQTITRERCEALLEVTHMYGSSFDPQRILPFVLSHYTRLAAELALREGEQDGELAKIMLKAICRENRALEPTYYNCIHSIHPRTQILWKLGSTACRCGKMENGYALMDSAFRQLADSNASVFQAIALVIRAEMASLNPEDLGESIEAIQKLYDNFLKGKPQNMLDPFESCGIYALDSGNADVRAQLHSISRRIAY